MHVSIVRKTTKYTASCSTPKKHAWKNWHHVPLNPQIFGGKASQPETCGSVVKRNFYPRGASDARVLAMIACVCVCVCVTRRYPGIVSKRLNVGSRKQHHVIAPIRDSSFLTPKFVGGRPTFPLKFALKVTVTHPLSNKISLERLKLETSYLV